MAAAEEMSVLPLILSVLPGGDDPDSATTRRRREVAAGSLALAAETLDVVAALEGGGVAAAPFKGPVLAVALGLGVAGRQSVDVDVLVRRADGARAWELLTAAGYAPLRTWSAAERAFQLKTGKGVVFKSQRGIHVELHFALTGRVFGVLRDTASFVDRAEPMDFAGGRVRTLVGEDLLLALAVHGSKHCWSEWKWLCDLALLVQQQPGIAWPAVLKRARGLGCERMLATGVAVSSRLTGIEVPREIAEMLSKSRRLQRLADATFERCAAGRDWTMSEQYRFHLAAAQGWAARARIAAAFCGGRLRPGAADRAAVRLPKRLSLLYYGVRPVRLLASAALGMTRRASRATKSSVEAARSEWVL